MASLGAVTYYLTCCRPASSFCYYVETPKLINLHFYPNDVLFQNLYEECYIHPRLYDHCLKPFSTCTDGRSWSLDNEQRRLHFLDIISGRIPLCGFDVPNCRGVLRKEIKKVKPIKVIIDEVVEIIEEKHKQPEVLQKEPSKVELEPEKPVEEIPEPTPEEIKHEPTPPPLERTPPPEEKPIPPPEEKPIPPPEEKPIPPPEEKPIPLPEEKPIPPPDIKPTPLPEEKPAPPPEPLEDICNEDTDLTDKIVDKLDQNLCNLESSFICFVEKNKLFVQSLTEILNFEKCKQDALEESYRKLKQENEILKTKNEYLKLVNCKQLELFRNELDKGMCENKAMYKKKICQMEKQLQADYDQLQHYKEAEKKYLEVVGIENKEITKLTNEIKWLKNKETKMLKNYVNILNFLEDVKDTLNNCPESNVLPMQRSSNTITDSGIDLNLRDVLKQALNKGMNSLNVRDLSIIHDAVQEINEDLCHNNDYCGKNPATSLSVTHISTIYQEPFNDYTTTDYVSKGCPDYETSSNLSIYPSRQKPDKRVRFTQ